jgi:N-acetylglutamate synthase-like GNAT family acetyltransferase
MLANQTNLPLSDAQADAIAQLLNTRNQLTVQYTRERVLKEAADYVLRFSETGEVIACVQVKKVQWYQAGPNHSLNRTHCGMRPKARHFILGL